MWFGIVSLFPEIFHALDLGVTGRAIKDNLLHLDLCNPRDFTLDKHQSVDDKPYGGGAGMVMMAGPLQAIRASKRRAPLNPRLFIYHPKESRLPKKPPLSLLKKSPLYWSQDDMRGLMNGLSKVKWMRNGLLVTTFLTGGEFAAMVMVDTIARLIPGVIGDENSVTEDSLSSGLLKYPQFTRPEHFETMPVPPVLLSGNHKEISRWRLKTSFGKTWLKRPDILAQKALTRRNQAY